ncbi:MAG: hypothetical protein DCC67_05410 [Planctomycetota bacterium]|nr:MAG: hypothetical protein DCC67_05410 [Planctomycetota bacterium]
MRLFVTGATGFIGSHFVNQALSAGHEVLGLRRTSSSRPRIPLDAEPQWVEKSMLDVAQRDVAGCDAIVHLAAHTANPPYDTLENCLYWNLTAPLGLFRVARRVGIDRFVVAGSCFEYGRSGERYEFIPPDAPLEPTLSYPASKAAASAAFIAFAVETQARLSIHRVFHVFGEGEHEQRLWPTLRRVALSGDDLPMTPGEQVRDFCPVEQVAATLLAACGEAMEPGRVIVENVGAGQPETVRAFAERWWRRWNAAGHLVFGALPYRVGEVMRYVPLLRRHVV